MDTACISGELARLAHDAAVPGAQLAVHESGETWTVQLGIEERGEGRLVTRESTIPIGSISKTFTAALAMVLVSEGDLELDAPVTEYLPDLYRAAGDRAGRLTLRHLLSHTSGLPSDHEQPRATSLRRHVLDCLRELDPLDRPGRAFSYSNIGYVLAGYLVEAVTGMSWWEAMEVVLLKPLGLNPAFVVGPTPRRHSAAGHSVNPVLGRVRPVRQSLALVEAPAGAIAASAADLVTLGRLLAGCADTDLIDPAVLAEMRTPILGAEPFGVADGWGLGLAMFRDGDQVWYGHDGTAEGTSCHLRFEPVSGTVVALTTNGSTGIPMWHELVTVLRGMGLRIGDYDGARRVESPTVPLAEYAGCAGGYRNGEMDYSVHRAGEKLHLTVDGESYGELVLYENLIFAVRDLDTGAIDQTGRFIRDSRRGEIGWIQVGGRLARRSDRAREVA
ncbi:MAG TPA: serine hydrolase domain-containing protein [Actinophytocola sp.]|uniref:serine hydrolase domain-containing protein n=1 Tax=Actinophytocola sp. TaxID=1872138 RepID=UPI002DBD2120|nr:serine hydrolase domain-containing protein [Actinophytocola sp.]HEU5470787.1 serine hydrolase domain-containing protein [Actinophytocola sp.]